MKRILLASVAALGLVGTASAADLAVRAPVAYVPAFTWTGCYLGANGGWVGSDSSYTSYYDSSITGITAWTTTSTNSYGPKDSAGTFGGQFGCQFQAGSWVIGGEWDWNWSGLKEDNTYLYTALPFTQYTHKEMDWFSTARVRVGLAWDRVLVYATGGLAYAGIEGYTRVDIFNNNALPLYYGAYDENRFGWTVGGGLEWAFSNNWTAKAEFLYMDFGSFDYRSHRTDFATTGHQWYTSSDEKEYVARIGLNYLFHTGGAPVVARY